MHAYVCVCAVAVTVFHPKQDLWLTRHMAAVSRESAGKGTNSLIRILSG